MQQPAAAAAARTGIAGIREHPGTRGTEKTSPGPHPSPRNHETPGGGISGQIGDLPTWNTSGHQQLRPASARRNRSGAYLADESFSPSPWAATSAASEGRPRSVAGREAIPGPFRPRRRGLRATAPDLVGQGATALILRRRIWVRPRPLVRDLSPWRLAMKARRMGKRNADDMRGKTRHGCSDDRAAAAVRYRVAGA
jgi:hypothetical protein